jgi:hypothetical protein
MVNTRIRELITKIDDIYADGKPSLLKFKSARRELADFLSSSVPGAVPDEG